MLLGDENSFYSLSLTYLYKKLKKKETIVKNIVRSPLIPGKNKLCHQVIGCIDFFFLTSISISDLRRILTKENGSF